MDAETSARQIAVIAQSETAWSLFVRSGQADLLEGAFLHQAQREVERRVTGGKGPKGSQERQLQAIERIRGYLAKHAQPF